MPETNGNRLDMLKKREAALRQAIEQERAKKLKRDQRARDRLVGIVGNALLIEAERAPDFSQLLKQVLATTVTDSSSKAFLKHMGWL
jgi:hypothetical protein